jgi:hypothetical protein
MPGHPLAVAAKFGMRELREPSATAFEGAAQSFDRFFTHAIALGQPTG